MQQPCRPHFPPPRRIMLGGLAGLGLLAGVTACNAGGTPTPAGNSGDITTVQPTATTPMDTGPMDTSGMNMTTHSAAAAKCTTNGVTPGENAQAAYQTLSAAGCSIIMHATNGKTVVLFSDWTVVDVKMEGSSVVVDVRK
ncbi:MAG TPA: hypothetical protein VHW44_13965 [Pseudonocardiaceae bacterium]|nr:hypothetical protein [Pseudonocardiaceae bacterium]